MVASCVVVAQSLSYRPWLPATTRRGVLPVRLLPPIQDQHVVKRAKRSGLPEPARPQQTPPVLPLERHSGEGSASALETLQKLEEHRSAAKPSDASDPS
jgi:hypothetical protein